MPTATLDQNETSHGAAREPHGLILFNRRPRPLTDLPRDEVVIPVPPALPQSPISLQMIAVLLPVLTAFFYGLTVFTRTGRGTSLWLTLPIVVISLISASLGVSNYVRQRRRHAAALAAHEHLNQEVHGDVRAQLTRLNLQVQEIHEANNPDMAVLHAVVECVRKGTMNEDDPELWGRRPADPDFLCIRYGRGDLPTSVTIKRPQVNQFQITPAARELMKLADEYETVRDVPLTVDMRACGSIGIAGSEDVALAAVRSLVCQLAFHHAPHEVRIVAVWPSEHDRRWGWLRWLPHTRSLDGDESYRLLARFDDHPAYLAQVLGTLQDEVRRRRTDANVGQQPHIVLIVDAYDRYGADHEIIAQLIRDGREVGISVMCVVEHAWQVPSACGGYLQLTSAPVFVRAGVGGGQQSFRTDQVDEQSSTAFARGLAPIVVLDTDARHEFPRSIPLHRLLQLDDLHIYAPDANWEAHNGRWRPISIGVLRNGEPLLLDLNEDVHGVHGIIAGMPGSGKSELLQTICLALVVLHGPDRLNLWLWDFKGGAAFADLRKLPHVVGVITDLDGQMAERAIIAIKSELKRREHLLARAGVPNIHAYRKAGYEQNEAFGPLPYLLVVIDEADTMFKDLPESVPELVRLAKQGRALGVQLLLATQQPSIIKDDLLRMMSYWIALRVNNVEDSKVMIGTAEASALTSATPGRGILRVGKDMRISFHSALVSLSYVPPSTSVDLVDIDVTGRHRVRSAYSLGADEIRELLNTLLTPAQEPLPGTILYVVEKFVAHYLALEAKERVPASIQYRQKPEEARQQISDHVHTYLSQGQHTGDSQLALEVLTQQLITCMQGKQRQEQEIALITDAMTRSRPLNYAAERYRIWTPPLPASLPLGRVIAGQMRQSSAWLEAAIGIADRPDLAEQPIVRLALGGKDGNVLVLGRAGSGKSTFLRTCILSNAYALGPTDLWVYVIDPSGTACGLSIYQLPHLADALAPQDAAKLDRLVLELQRQVSERRQLFQAHGVDTLGHYRAAHTHNTALPTPPPALLIAIDNISELLTTRPDLLDPLKQLMRDGQSCGIVFVITGYTWRDVSALQSHIETRIALRLNDQADSEACIGTAHAARMADGPGRAWRRTSGRPVEIQVSLPDLQGLPRNGNDTISEGATNALAVACALISDQYPAAAIGMPSSLRTLPECVVAKDLLCTVAADPEGCRVPIGVENSSLTPYVLDFARTSANLLIAGGYGSGKQTLLMTTLGGLTARSTPTQVQLILVDYQRRTLQPFAALPHTRLLPAAAPEQGESPERLITNEQQLKAVVGALVPELNARRELGITAPRLFLVINNWDVFFGTEPSILNALTPFIIQGRDLGFHLITTGIEYNGASSSSFFRMARHDRCVIHLGAVSEQSNVATALGVKLPKIAPDTLPPGRGYALQQGQWSLVQCARPPCT